MNSGGSNNVSLKYERYESSGFWDLGIIKLAFVTKTQFLWTPRENILLKTINSTNCTTEKE